MLSELTGGGYERATTASAGLSLVPNFVAGALAGQSVVLGSSAAAEEGQPRRFLSIAGVREGEGGAAIGIFDTKGTAEGDEEEAVKWLTLTEFAASWEWVEVCRTFPDTWSRTSIQGSVLAGECRMYQLTMHAEARVAIVLARLGGDGAGGQVGLRIDCVDAHQYDTWCEGLASLVKVLASVKPVHISTGSEPSCYLGTLVPGAVYLLSICGDEHAAPDASEMQFSLEINANKFTVALDELGLLRQAMAGDGGGSPQRTERRTEVEEALADLGVAQHDAPRRVVSEVLASTMLCCPQIEMRRAIILRTEADVGLGMTLQSPLAGTCGVRVVRIKPGSPAARCGALRQNDVLLEVNRVPMFLLERDGRMIAWRSHEEVLDIIAAAGPSLLLMVTDAAGIEVLLSAELFNHSDARFMCAEEVPGTSRLALRWMKDVDMGTLDAPTVGRRRLGGALGQGGLTPPHRWNRCGTSFRSCRRSSTVASSSASISPQAAQRRWLGSGWTWPHGPCTRCRRRSRTGDE